MVSHRREPAGRRLGAGTRSCRVTFFSFQEELFWQSESCCVVIGVVHCARVV